MARTAESALPIRPSVFISYSHDDRAFVRHLVAEFESHSCNVFIDEADIPAASAWREELEDGIRESDNIVFVVTPTFVGSTECGEELAQAVKCGKRLIPVIREVCDVVPAALGERQFIFMLESDDFKPAFETLLFAVTTDLEFARQHSLLMTRVDSWLTHDRSRAYLLRGEELLAAEAWIERSSEVAEPKPTTSLVQYLVSSRRAASNRRNLLVLATALGILLVAASGWFYQRQQSEAASRHVADAYQWMRREPLRAIDSAMAAASLNDSSEAMSAIAAAQGIAAARVQNLRDEATLDGRPDFFGIGVMKWRTGEVYSRLRSDGRYALIASKRGRDGAAGGTGEVFLMDLNSMRTAELENERTAQRRLEYMGFSSDGDKVLVTRQFELDVYHLDGSVEFSQQLGRSAQPLHIAAGFFHGTWVLVCDSERQMWFVDTATGDVSSWFERTREGAAVMVEPSAAGTHAVIVFESGAVSLLTVLDPNDPSLTRLDAENATVATFHDATGRFATGGKSGSIDVWALRPDGADRIGSFEQGAAAGLVRFSDTGDRLIAVAEDGSLRAWIIDPAEQIAAYPYPVH